MNRHRKVLDKGFVRLVDCMGDDSSVVEAARVSVSGEGVQVRSKDEALIRYLMRHRHTTPFEMVDFKFHIKAPIFVVRQWHRHRTQSYNEMSARYSELPAEWYVPDVERIRTQSLTNRQGSSDESVKLPENWCARFDEEADRVHERYRFLLSLGGARELARINLPVSTYTEFYAKANLQNWFHFLGLRMDSHAQHEIRMYANAIGEMIGERCPLSWQAFEDYRLNGMYFSSYDVEALGNILRNTNAHHSMFPTKREYTEFVDKVKRMFDGIDPGLIPEN